MRHKRRPVEDLAGRFVWYSLIVYLLLCLFGGGSNLYTAPALVVLRPAGILLVAALLMMPMRPDAPSMRVPILLLAAFTLAIVVQLIPLPPALWNAIPGRAMLAELANGVGQGAVWRPLSLTPAITLGSLYATLVAWVVALAFPRLPSGRRRSLVGIVIIMAVASCAIGLLQLIGGTNSIFYFYPTDASISGLLANRNHQAALMAMTLPLLRVWSMPSREATDTAQLARQFAAILLGVLVLGMTLLTGSRSGLVLALVGIAGAYFIAPFSGGITGKPRRRKLVKWAVRLGLLAVPVLLVVVAIWAGRDLSIQRLFTADYAGEARLRSLPTVLLLVKTYLPFGSGFGSFDAVFRLHEPDALLKPTFFNRAHNDYLELAITGGVFSLLVLAAFLAWMSAQGFRAFRRSWQEEGVLEARAGVLIVLILALASLSDYPVRAPLIAVIASIAVCWIASMRRPPSRAAETGAA